MKYNQFSVSTYYLNRNEVSNATKVPLIIKRVRWNMLSHSHPRGEWLAEGGWSMHLRALQVSMSADGSPSLKKSAQVSLLSAWWWWGEPRIALAAAAPTTGLAEPAWCFGVPAPSLGQTRRAPSPLSPHALGCRTPAPRNHTYQHRHRHPIEQSVAAHQYHPRFPFLFY